MKKYFWEENIEFGKANELKQQIETDILIIGGGMTGISTAYQLQNTNQRITIVDQGRIGCGTTRGTTAKITYLQDTIYQRLTNNFGLEVALAYLNAEKEAIELITETVKREKIDCDLTKADSYIFASRNSGYQKVLREQKILKQFGIETELKTKFPHPFPIQIALNVKDTYVFHPLKYLMALKEKLLDRGVAIYENTKVTELQKSGDHFLVRANQHTITARIVVLACHYPFFTVPFFIPFKTYLEKSYITAFPIAKVQPSHAISIDQPVYSLRYHFNGRQHYGIFLSNSHRLGSDLDELQNKKIMLQKTEDFFKKKASYYWSNYDLLTSDGLPYIGRLEEQEKNLYIATGYSTWGMTNGTIAGKVIADLILHGTSCYEDLFSPNRKICTDKMVNFFVNNFHSSKTYLLTKVKKEYDFYPQNVYTYRKNGKNYGVYIDEQKEKHIVTLKCPHLLCNVVFNPDELTWDCPCHGSRYDLDGNVIRGPSTYSISAKEESDPINQLKTDIS